MPSKTQSILMAGLVVGVGAAVVALVPVVGGCVACLAYIGAGMLAVWHYTSTHRLSISGGQGAGLGALAAVVAGLVALLLGYLLVAIGLQPDPQEVMRQQFEATDMDPTQRDQFIAMFSSPLFMIGVSVVFLVLEAIVGAIGGAIGASVFKKGPEEPYGETPPRGDV